MSSPGRIPVMSPRMIMPRSSGAPDPPHVTASPQQIVVYLENMYRYQNPQDDYHVIYVERPDRATFEIYKSFSDLCTGAPYVMELDTFLGGGTILPNHIVVGPTTASVSHSRDSPANRQIRITVSSPQIANQLRDCLRNYLG